MNDPIPTPRSYAPSSSTNASTVGAGLAAILFLILDRCGVKVDAISAATIGGAISAALGYFFDGGRK